MPCTKHNYKSIHRDVRRKMPEFVSSVKTEFTDRDRALAQIAEWAEKSTRWPVVVFGPEDCGKTAFLRQAAMLRELGCDFFYLHLLDRVFSAEVDDPTLRRSSQTLWGRRWRRRNGATSRW
jgi:polynucleotide 5'-kinase involved in rRNA processing